MNYKDFSYSEIQNFRLLKSSSEIEKYWEEIYSNMPKQLKDLYNSAVHPNNAITKLKLSFATHTNKDLGSAVPYKFTLETKDISEKEFVELQLYLDNFILVVDWP